MDYFKYIFVNLRISLMKEMQFRTNFVTKLLVGLLESLMFIIFYSVLLGQNVTFQIWQDNEIYLFMGSFLVMNGLYKVFFEQGVGSLTRYVRTGELDGLLIRPLNTRFLLAFGQLNLGAIPGIIIGFFLISRSNYFNQFHLGLVVGYLVLIGLGVYLLYLIKFVLTASAFWMIRTGELETIFSTLLEFSDKPYLIYPRWIHLLFSYGTAFFLVGNYQVMFMSGRLSGGQVLMTLLSLITWSILAHLLWKKGLKIYHGASR